MPADPTPSVPPPTAPVPFPPLATGAGADAVRLRRHRAGDLDDVLAQCADPAMQRWTTIPLPYTRADGEGFLAGRAQAWADGSTYSLAIEHGGRFAGSVDLRPDGPGAAELGFGLAPWARGRRVLSRALRMLLPWGFAALDLDVVHWRAEVGNWASRRAAWSVGFRHDGTVRALLGRGAGEGRADEPRRRDGWVATLLAGEPLQPVAPWIVPPVLRGDGVVLRALRDADAPRIQEGCADPATQHWLPFMPRDYSLDDARAHLVDVADGQACGTRVVWAVADPDTDELLAEVSVFGLGGRSRLGELGYWTHPQARRRGLTSAAARLAAAHALAPRDGGGLGCDALLLRAAVGNDGSIGVAGAAGFTPSGRDSRADLLPDGTTRDLLRFERLA